MKSVQSQIDNIMDNFDFTKVQESMEFLGWKWYNQEGYLGVPTEHELRKTARSLLRQVSSYDKPEWNVSTGGLCARIAEGELSLKFVLSEWHGEDE